MAQWVKLLPATLAYHIIEMVLVLAVPLLALLSEKVTEDVSSAWAFVTVWEDLDRVPGS